MDDNENELFNQNSPLLSPFNDKQNNSLSINIDTYNNMNESSETQNKFFEIMKTSSNEQNNEKDLPIKKEEIKFIISKNNLGRKRKLSSEKGIHTKYDKDNILRKIKSILIKHLINCINELINQIYKGKIGCGLFRKKFFTMNQSQIIDSRNDKRFIYKSLKDILSEDITGRITNSIPEHNRNLIELLLNEEDLKKKEKFEEFFNLKFIDCIKHFCGQEKLIILDGLELLDETCKHMKGNDDVYYIRLFNSYAENFEHFILSKKNRKSNKAI